MTVRARLVDAGSTRCWTRWARRRCRRAGQPGHRTRLTGGHDRELRRRGHRGPADQRDPADPVTRCRAGGSARLLEQSQLVIKVQTFPLDRAAEAHRLSQAGPHPRQARACCPDRFARSSGNRLLSSAGERHTTAEIGIIGGSGFYSFAADAEPVTVSTPYGDPTAPLEVGELAGRRVAFVARHGIRARVPAAPGELPGQPVGAALAGRPAGAGAVCRRLPAPGPRRRAPSWCPIRCVDRTWGRAHTFFDRIGSVGHAGVRRSVLPRRSSSGARGRRHLDRRRHAGGGQRTTVLESGRVDLARGAGLVAGGDDRTTRSGAGPRARAVLHLGGSGHRSRRRARGGGRGHPRRGAGHLRRQRRPAAGPVARGRSPLWPNRPERPTGAPAGTRWTGCRNRSTGSGRCRSTLPERSR